jgi:hypothetical protein
MLEFLGKNQTFFYLSSLSLIANFDLIQARHTGVFAEAKRREKGRAVLIFMLTPAKVNFQFNFFISLSQQAHQIYNVHVHENSERERKSEHLQKK